MLRVTLQERSKPRELQEHEDEGQSLPGRWVNSHELRAGDCIITRSGTPALITEIRQRFDDAFPVSNLSIIGHHNYAVGDVGVLVHNITVCEETIADLRELYAKEKSEGKIRDWLRSQTDNDGNRLYDDSEIDDAMKLVLAPEIIPGVGSPAVTPQHFGMGKGVAGKHPALMIDGKVYVHHHHLGAQELAGTRPKPTDLYGFVELDANGNVIWAHWGEIGK